MIAAESGSPKNQPADDIERDRILGAGTDTVVERPLGDQHLIDIARAIRALQTLCFLHQRREVGIARLFNELFDDKRFQRSPYTVGIFSFRLRDDIDRKAARRE